MSNDLKIGDLVRIKDEEFLRTNRHTYDVAESMYRLYHDKITRIKSTSELSSGRTIYRLEIDNGHFYWFRETLCDVCIKTNDEMRGLIDNDI